jgi:hypothetical protein
MNHRLRSELVRALNGVGSIHCTVCHVLQFSSWPVCVGPGGVVDCTRVAESKLKALGSTKLRCGRNISSLMGVRVSSE